MFDRDIVKIVSPLALLSIALLGLGAAAAWTIHSQQIETSNLLVSETDSLLVTHEFYASMRDVRRLMRNSSPDNASETLPAIERCRDKARERLQRLSTMTGSEQKQEVVSDLESSFTGFWSAFDRICEKPDSAERRVALGDLAGSDALSNVLDATDRLLDLRRQAALRAGETSRGSFARLRWGFLILGLCGCAAGILGGLVWAKSLRRSIVQLEVSVRSTAGILESISGPVRITRTGGFRELETELGRIESQIGELVARVHRSETELLRSEQLAAIGQLAAGIAHEMRNPLMPIKMLVQAALERDDDRGLHGRQLEVVDEEIRRLERSIQVFLEFARPVPPQMASFDLRGSISQTLELVQARAKTQRVALHPELPGDPVWMVADAGQIRQVFLNILLNALDALAEGGEIVVAIRRVAPEDVPEIARGISWCETVISDNGPGIPAELLPRVFEPFITSKETGTGLGLSICQRIVQAHGGEIGVRNAPPRGAEFSIRLPCLPADAIAAEFNRSPRSVESGVSQSR